MGQFSGIFVSKQIIKDENLNYFQKCLMAHIHSLDKDDNFYGSNLYLCDLFSIARSTLQENLQYLKKLSYITADQIPGGGRVVRSNLNLIYGFNESLKAQEEIKKSSTGPGIRAGEARESVPPPHREFHIGGKKSLRKKREEREEPICDDARNAARHLLSSIRETDKDFPDIYEDLWARMIQDFKNMNLQHNINYPDIINVINYCKNNYRQYKRGVISRLSEFFSKFFEFRREMLDELRFGQDSINHPPQEFEESKKRFNDIKVKFSYLEKQGKISFGSDYVDFMQPNKYFKLTEKTFWSNLIHSFSKMGIQI